MKNFRRKLKAKNMHRRLFQGQKHYNEHLHVAGKFVGYKNYN